MVCINVCAILSGDRQFAAYCKDVLFDKGGPHQLPGGWPSSTHQLTRLGVTTSDDEGAPLLLNAEGKLYGLKRIGEKNTELLNRFKDKITVQRSNRDDNLLIAVLFSDFTGLSCHVDFIEDSESEPERLRSFRISDLGKSRIFFKVMEVSFARDNNPILIEAKYYAPDFGLVLGKYLQVRRKSTEFSVDFHHRMLVLFRKNPDELLSLVARGEVVLEYRTEALVAPPALCELLLLDGYDQPFIRLRLPDGRMLDALEGTPDVPVNHPEYTGKYLDLQSQNMDSQKLQLFKNLGTNKHEEFKTIELPSGTFVRVSHRGDPAVNELLDNLKSSELAYLEHASEREIVPIIVRR